MKNAIRWDVLTIGSITRNRFWGEGDERALRPVMCTSALLRTEDRTILVDPSEAPEAMEATLYRRAGIHAGDINAVFITHHHGDHAMGLKGLRHAAIYMPKEEIALSEIDGLIPLADGDEIAPGIRLVSLAGHTLGLCGLAFTAAEGRVVVAGDAVMTRDFFRSRLGYYNSVDFTLCAKTHDKIAGIADVIVPGHDNYFLVGTA